MKPRSASSVEESVISRYSQGAKAREEALCCPTSFDPRFLAVLPEEILERDYGCGDPTPYVRPGDRVLDLGSGAGKVCWIAAQITGQEGEVIGVDMNTDMLDLARSHHHEISERVGYDNVRYRRGMIQDLRLDLDLLARELAAAPVDSPDSWLAMRQVEADLRDRQPMIPDESVDVVLSNCVLNLVRPEDKQQLFNEIFRVVKPGGRVAISDIVSDEDIPAEMQADPELWSGCISGAYREDKFLEAFEDAGFYGMQIMSRDSDPWQTVEGIEFRALTVQAFKAASDEGLDRNQAVVYMGPFSQVADDSGQVFFRGERMAVSDRTFTVLQSPPYAGLFSSIEPRVPISQGEAEPFTAETGSLRHPRESKGEDYRVNRNGSSSCAGPEPESCC
ncbi:MAG: methyltransferase domain-containing protein [Planctomycetota bacterium]|jgi:ubiquinone/menaquinone biosynthesis C-methylase UbiE